MSWTSLSARGQPRDQFVFRCRTALVGATTQSGSSILRERFGIHLRMVHELDELREIVSRGARLLDTPLAADGATEIARRSRGTPRVAGRLLRRVRDFAMVDGVEHIDAKAADAALQRLGVDALGLDAMDRRYLTCVAENYGGGPVGVETLSAALSEQRDVIEDVIEPYLMQEGLIQPDTTRPDLYAKVGLIFQLEAPRCRRATRFARFDAGRRGGRLECPDARSRQNTSFCFGSITRTTPTGHCVLHNYLRFAERARTEYLPLRRCRP